MSKRFKSVFEQQVSSDKDWNMVVAYFQVVIERVKAVDEASTTGDLVGWYRNLKTLWRNIEHMVNLELKIKDDLSEVKTGVRVKELFDDILVKLSESEKSREFFELEQGEAETLLDELNTILYGLMHGSHLILPEKTDFDPIDEESQSYGGQK